MESTSLNIIAVLFAWAQGLLAPILALVISVVYFISSPRTEPLSKRILASAHGVVITAIYMGAMTVFWAQKANPKFITPFLFSLLVPLLLIAVSFFVYRGRKTVHFLQLLNLLCLGWTFFIGSMAVTGDWL
jgi:hypothetical protein